MVDRSNVPVYLPDRTVIGMATINAEDGTAWIHIQSDCSLAKAFKQELIGLSVVYLDKEAANAVLNKENDN